MKFTSLALIATSLAALLPTGASAASVRPTPYPAHCDGPLRTFVESDRVCYYFVMRERYGAYSNGLPFDYVAPEGYADPRMWRFGRVHRYARR